MCFIRFRSQFRSQFRSNQFSPVQPVAIFRSQYLLTVDSAYADLRAVDPNPFPMNDRDGPWLRNVFNGLRKDYTLMMQRWNASGQQNPEAEVAD